MKRISVFFLAFLFCYPIFGQGKLGKVWYSNFHIYINKVNEGVWIINNLNPRQPKVEGLVRIIGCVDLAVQNNVLYANNYNDLVAIDISDLRNIKEISRIENALPNRLPKDADILRSDKIIRWQPAQVLAVPQSSTSKGGSMSCFSIYGNTLYAIDDSNIRIFDVTSPENIERRGKVPVGNDIETIFSADQKLFIGSKMGMYIYDIRTADLPVFLSKYQHTRSCDPVVIEGNFAYITMRDGTDCAGAVNQLDIVDISNPQNPRKIRTYPMTNPHGLGIDNGILFICDGRAGLKVFDAKNANNLVRLYQEPNINTYDVIPVDSQKILIMVNQNTLNQYDYANPNNISPISSLSF